MIIVIFGVSGSGKSTIAEALAKALNRPYYDADDFHPSANIEKMSNGMALDDSDREPWLQSLAQHIFDWSQKDGAVLACSALKEKYRTLLGSKSKEDIIWVYLKGTYEQIQSRMENRKDHFMSPQMLESQFEALEVPNYGLHIDISSSPETIVASILKKL